MQLPPQIPPPPGAKVTMALAQPKMPLLTVVHVPNLVGSFFLSFAGADLCDGLCGHLDADIAASNARSDLPLMALRRPAQNGSIVSLGSDAWIAFLGLQWPWLESARVSQAVTKSVSAERNKTMLMFRLGPQGFGLRTQNPVL